MPRVLVIAYSYPPAGNVGVHRTLRFLKWLPRLGWDPVVLTPRNARGVNLQPSLLDRVGAVDVHRTYSFEALNPGKSIDRVRAGAIESRLQRYLWQLPRTIWKSVAVPDARLGWVPFGITGGTRVLRGLSVDAIYVTGKPFSSYLIADRLGRHFGLPWVMDVRDLWALNRRDPDTNWWHRQMNARLEERMVKRAAMVIANTPGNKREFVEAYATYGADKFVTITNGFDQDDFAGPAISRPENFTIVYTGTFYFGKQSKPSGEIFETHSPWFLFQALANLFAEDDEMRRRCRVVVAGPRCELAKELASRCGVSDIVQLKGWVSHRESLKLQRQAHLALLVLARGEQSRSWVPAKLYQYLGSGTPILALIPDGDAAQIIRETDAGVVVPPDGIAQIERVLRCAYARFRRGEAPARPSTTAVRQYEAEMLTRQLVDVLNRATGRFVGEPKRSDRDHDREATRH